MDLPVRAHWSSHTSLVDNDQAYRFTLHDEAMIMQRVVEMTTPLHGGTRTFRPEFRLTLKQVACAVVGCVPAHLHASELTWIHAAIDAALSVNATLNEEKRAA